MQGKAASAQECGELDLVIVDEFAMARLAGNEDWIPARIERSERRPASGVAEDCVSLPHRLGEHVGGKVPMGFDRQIVDRGTAGLPKNAHIRRQDREETVQ
jgi:hypothetical protein